MAVNWQKLFQSAKEVTVDLLFPKFCFGCGRGGVWLCADCATRVPRWENQRCWKCSRQTVCGFTCPSCSTTAALRGVVSAAPYQDLVVRKLIRSYKYHSAHDLDETVSRLIVPVIDELIGQNIWTHVDLIVPIPLHPKRLRQRGFNQAERIATILSGIYGWPMASLLIRQHEGTPQATLTGEERRRNMEGVFALAGQSSLTGKTILLVDDVVTTGSTLEAAAKIIRNAGAKEVWGVTIAAG